MGGGRWVRCRTCRRVRGRCRICRRVRGVVVGWCTVWRAGVVVVEVSPGMPVVPVPFGVVLGRRLLGSKPSLCCGPWPQMTRLLCALFRCVLFFVGFDQPSEYATTVVGCRRCCCCVRRGCRLSQGNRSSGKPSQGFTLRNRMDPNDCLFLLNVLSRSTGKPTKGFILIDRMDPNG